jgi:hypothetical protein
MTMVMAKAGGRRRCYRRRRRGSVRYRRHGRRERRAGGGESGEPRSSLLGVNGVDGVGALPPCECCEAMRDCEAECLDDGNRGRLNGREGEVESGWLLCGIGVRGPR